MKTIYTVGHSTRTIGEFITLLQEYGIEKIIDVRKIAKSRHNPQYSEDNLGESLKEHAISYKRMEGLGGLRHTTGTSVNQGWRNRSFRGYADYMQTSEFVQSIAELIERAKEKPTAIMCAEAVPWRCHRSLIGDALVIRGIRVEDILSEKSLRPHILTSFAHVIDGTITYPKIE